MIDETKINILRNAGLVVLLKSEGPYKGGYSIAKPENVQGNSRMGCRVYFGPDQILTDAPSSHLFFRNGKFVFSVKLYFPGPGLGDFEEEFEDVESCLQSILDYYFGDPARMNPRK